MLSTPVHSIINEQSLMKWPFNTDVCVGGRGGTLGLGCDFFYSTKKRGKVFSSFAYAMVEREFYLHG